MPAPFLLKLRTLTSSCPSHVGGWSDDGKVFIVKSSAFADVVNEHFSGSLQTFVRQLHFYNFSKQERSEIGTWSFQHPYFQRNRDDLLVNIERKPTSKKLKSSQQSYNQELSPKMSSSSMRSISGGGSAPAAAAAAGGGGVAQVSGQYDAAYLKSLEARLLSLESRVQKVTELERTLKQVQEDFKSLQAVHGILMLDKSDASSSASTGEKSVPATSSSKVGDKRKLFESGSTPPTDLRDLPPLPSKVVRLASGDSVKYHELQDFPFEDNSSVGSISTAELMRELQVGIFSEFDDVFPELVDDANASSNGGAGAATDSMPEHACASEKDNDDCMTLLRDFQLQPGVSRSLLREAFEVLGKACCPRPVKNPVTGNEYPPLPYNVQRMIIDLPDPSTLPEPQNCTLSRDLLPILRASIQEKADDLTIMRCARNCYEVYYQLMTKKLSGMKQQ